MQLDNPLPVLIGIPFMAVICGWLSKHFTILEDEDGANRKSLPLDGLRGILASSVFFHHANITYGYFTTRAWLAPLSNFYAQLGPTAVTLFFFISGYLFWGKMLRKPESLRWSKLLPNRLRRIMPAYLVAVLVLFINAAITSRLRLHVGKVALLSEMTSWICGGFPFPDGPPLNGIPSVVLAGGVFWTLQQEWVFYFVLPILTWFRSLPRVFVLFALVFVATLALPLPNGLDSLTAGVLTILKTFAHMFLTGFAVGMLAAYPRAARIDRVLSAAWMTPVAALLITAQLLYVPPTEDSWLEPVLIAPIFFMVVSGNSFGGLLTNRFMRSLGTVSYSFYVFHGLILHAVATVINVLYPISRMTPLEYWLAIVPIACIVVLWSVLSFRFIEKPFLPDSRRLVTTAETMAP